MSYIISKYKGDYAILSEEGDVLTKGEFLFEIENYIRENEIDSKQIIFSNSISFTDISTLMGDLDDKEENLLNKIKIEGIEKTTAQTN